jgi:superfamily II DNA or RNA helicase
MPTILIVSSLVDPIQKLSHGGSAPPFSCPILISSTANRMTLTLRPHQQRMLDALLTAGIGRVTCPTGGGKTLVMILDCLRRLQAAQTPQTVVVCAPRILLAVQLYEEFWSELNGKVDATVLHVHSGEVDCHHTTKVREIVIHDSICKAANSHQIIFTTYNSLRRINEAGIDVDLIYYDEAHNSVRRDFYMEVAAASLTARNAYYFTATPKYRGGNISMHNTDVYGKELINIPAPELVSNGSIIPPTIKSHLVDIERNKSLLAAENDREVLIDIVSQLDEDSAQKILVAAPNTRVLWRLLSNTNVMAEFAARGYDVLHITSKHGAYINKQKVGRQEFFDTLDLWGKDPSRKFIMFHYSILSEGINVPGLTHCILLRNLPVIEMAQTIGRVIRLDKQDAADIQSGKIPAGQLEFYRKKTGFVTVPVFSNYGQQTEKRLQRVVDAIFIKGVAPTE